MKTYRFLVPGDVVQKGDEVEAVLGMCDWWPATAIGLTIMEHHKKNTYRRAVDG